MIAGPRVLEHMVDTVLYLEGERGHQFRVLRAVKNRCGPNRRQIGMFEMTDTVSTEVPNPSALFLADRRNAITGAAVFAGMEGTRPMLVEIQALVAPTSYGTPRRAVIGWEPAAWQWCWRCSKPAAASSSARRRLPQRRWRVAHHEPAADLAVAAALLSSLHRKPCPPTRVVFGEIGLSGEVRPVSQAELRLKEAAKLGFTQVILPATDQRPQIRR